MSYLSVLQNIKEVYTSPYPYVCVEEALPENIYKELEETFPEELVTSTNPHDGGITYRYKCKEANERPIPAIWQDFFAYHTSPEYFSKCIELFGPSIEKYYSSDTLRNFLRGHVTTRDVDNSGSYVTDCQFVVHEPVDQTGTSRTPHVDNPVEIYAGLLYMRKPNDTSAGGNFTIHEQTGNIEQVNKSLGRQVADNIHKPVREVPYKANSFCMFLNVMGSIHSVTPRIQPTERRRSINIIGEFNGNGKMWKVKEIKN
jgi:hypothetical protein